jgi:hypothetical protein
MSQNEGNAIILLSEWRTTALWKLESVITIQHYWFWRSWFLFMSLRKWKPLSYETLTQLEIWGSISVAEISFTPLLTRIWSSHYFVTFYHKLTSFFFMVGVKKAKACLKCEIWGFRSSKDDDALNFGNAGKCMDLYRVGRKEGWGSGSISDKEWVKFLPKCTTSIMMDNLLGQLWVMMLDHKCKGRILTEPGVTKCKPSLYRALYNWRWQSSWL